MRGLERTATTELAVGLVEYLNIGILPIIQAVKLFQPDPHPLQPGTLTADAFHAGSDALFLKTRDGSFLDEGGKVLYFSCERFARDICEGNCDSPDWPRIFSVGAARAEAHF
jgi:hypothetical protein